MTTATTAKAEPGFMSVRELCQLLSISRSTADVMLKRGDLPSYRVGHLIRIPRAAIAEYLRQRAQ